MAPPDEYCSSWELRRVFNAEHYYQRLLDHEFVEEVIEDAHPAPDDSHQPYCTRSQLVSYINRDGECVAIVHHYRLRTGEIGASGRPDPKELLIDGTWWIADE